VFNKVKTRFYCARSSDAAAAQQAIEQLFSSILLKVCTAYQAAMQLLHHNTCRAAVLGDLTSAACRTTRVLRAAIVAGIMNACALAAQASTTIAPFMIAKRGQNFSERKARGARNNTGLLWTVTVAAI
jgi:hypothetical protein